MSRSNLAWLLGVPAVMIVGLTLVFAAPRQQRPKDQDYELVQLVVEVLGEVDQKYVRELSPEQKRKFVSDMINGGLERLDPHSSFFDVQEYDHFDKQNKGEFGGIGIHVGLDRASGLLRVTSPMPNTPAYEAGILAGDLILKVDGKPLDVMRQSEVVAAIQGVPGTEVTLTVQHEGAKEPVDITMKRAKIETPSVMGDRRKPANPAEWDYFVDPALKIAYVRLVAFNEHSVADLKKTIESIQAEGARGLVLDLRDNPGGLLKQAVEICDLFMTSGPIVSTRDRKGKGPTYEAGADGTLLEPAATHPMAVLINGNSASASEIVAAALQDSKRAIVVGERSYGKGSVQHVIELGDREPKVALKLTTSSYWRPSGANIHRSVDMKESDEWGVKPTAGYEIKIEDAERLEYLRWRRARDVVHGKNGPAPKKTDDADGVSKDRYLEKALEYIRSELKK